MVYIPQGGFFAGDNATSTSAFRQGSSDNDPWWIESEAAISVTNSAGSGTGVRPEKAAEYYYVSGGNVGEDATGAAFTIPAAFPKGYQGFYMMKGEISQAQWVNFFNTLTSTQKTTRDVTSGSAATNVWTGKGTDGLLNRNNVSWTSGDATLPDQGGGARYEGVAMNFIHWGDVTAYLDWAGLRPMSELEFERAGRGPYRAVSGEYAWGSTSITGVTSITNGGLSNEAPGNAANCVYNNTTGGPMRVGAMAYGDSTRIASGAGYYGVMDLSGNGWERCVTVGNSTGRAFEGRYHGNGSLDNSGNPNVSTWPGTTGGAGYRGGAWEYAFWANLSNRTYAAYYTPEPRHNSRASRGVRTAPLWNPSQLSTALWLDAADSSTVTTVSGAVSQWNDKSGNARNVSQATVASRPTYTTAGLNGLNVVTFDGSNDSISNSTYTFPTVYSIYAVGRNSNTGYSRLLNVGVVDTFGFFGSNSSNYATFFGNGVTWNDVAANTPAQSVTSTSILGLVKDNTVGGAIPYVNGTAQNTKSGTTASTTGFILGGAMSQQWNGIVAELIILPVLSTTTQRQQIEGYLAWKWGLQANLNVSHPYYKNPPPR